MIFSMKLCNYSLNRERVKIPKYNFEVVWVTIIKLWNDIATWKGKVHNDDNASGESSSLRIHWINASSCELICNEGKGRRRETGQEEDSISLWLMILASSPSLLLFFVIDGGGDGGGGEGGGGRVVAECFRMS